MDTWQQQLAHRYLAFPNFDFILPNLAVGAQFPVSAIPELAKHSFTSVVDLRAEARPATSRLRQAGIRPLHVPARDNYAPTQPQLDQAVRWIESELEAGGKVLVHCRAGIGRSVLTVCAVLVHQGAAPQTAFDTVRASRAIAAFSPEQWQALFTYAERQHLPEHRPAFGAPQSAQLRLT